MSTTERRKNGLQLPWTWQQFLAIAVILTDAVLFCRIIGSVIQMWWLDILYFLSWLSVSTLGIFIMIQDPSDPQPEIQLEDAVFCLHCKMNVRRSMKHCFYCNKCVDDFDHHCPWLNTCINGKNYKLFIYAICSLLAMLTLFLTGALLAILSCKSFLSKTSLFIIGVATPNIFLWLLDATLMCLHVFLYFKGITTYELILRMRRKPSSWFSWLNNIEEMDSSLEIERSNSEWSTDATPVRTLSRHLQRHVSGFLLGDFPKPEEHVQDETEFNPWEERERKRKMAKDVQGKLTIEGALQEDHQQVHSEEGDRQSAKKKKRKNQRQPLEWESSAAQSAQNETLLHVQPQEENLAACDSPQPVRSEPAATCLAPTIHWWTSVILRICARPSDGSRAHPPYIALRKTDQTDDPNH